MNGVKTQHLDSVQGRLRVCGNKKKLQTVWLKKTPSREHRCLD